jgi:quinol monooxygenase YgiN
MATVLVLHQVNDYGKWREIYDSARPMQAAGGVLEEAAFRAEGDPLNVLVMHRFASMAEAHAYFENPDLADAVREAGVDEATVRLEFYEEA